MNLNTCPNHPGLIIENRPCPRCGHPQVLPEGREPYRHKWLADSRIKEAPVEQQPPTAALESEIEAGREYVRELVWRELDAEHRNCLTCIHYREDSLTGTLYCRVNARIKDPLAAYETRLRTVLQRRCKKWEGDA